jgi:hypothetical protein
MAKAHRLPLCQQVRGALADCLKKRRVGVAIKTVALAAFGIVPINDLVCQGSQFVMLIAVREMLEVAKTNEAGGHAGDNGRRFGFLPIDGMV